MASTNEPLHGRAADEVRDLLRERLAQDVRTDRKVARALLEEFGSADIHNHAAVVEAYATLRGCLGHLLDSLDAQGGDR